MMDVATLNLKLNTFFLFARNKLRAFPTLSRGEQISYVAILLGLVLILTAIILFVI